MPCWHLTQYCLSFTDLALIVTASWKVIDAPLLLHGRHTQPVKCRGPKYLTNCIGTLTPHLQIEYKAYTMTTKQLASKYKGSKPSGCCCHELMADIPKYMNVKQIQPEL